jgi:hypothetical protein
VQVNGTVEDDDLSGRRESASQFQKSWPLGMIESGEASGVGGAELGACAPASGEGGDSFRIVE